MLEKHADFLRDFRGDTDSSLDAEVMNELGLLDEFLKLPHEKVRHRAFVRRRRIHLADFNHLPTRCKFIALMPQWDFLNFLAEKGKSYPSFHLRMRAEATDLIEEGGRVAGVRANAADGDARDPRRPRVGCDGRHSIVRERAGFTAEDIGAPIDVLWFRARRNGPTTGRTLGRIDAGPIIVMHRPRRLLAMRLRHPQGRRRGGCSAPGLPAFRASVLALTPLLADRVEEIRTGMTSSC